MVPHSVQRNTVIGTPQERCLEMHQSGLLATMLWMRSRPQPGIHCTRSIQSRALRRRSFFSIEMNHWGVARKMTGFLQRQQWG